MLEGCRREAGLADVGPSFRGTYVKTIKPKRADNDELGQTIVRTQKNASAAVNGPADRRQPKTPRLCYLSSELVCDRGLDQSSKKTGMDDMVGPHAFHFDPRGIGGISGKRRLLERLER